MTSEAPAAPQLMQLLVKMLGLAPEATEDDVLAALVATLKPKDAAKPDPAKYVPVEAVQAMMRERNEAQATQAENRAKEKVADANRKGYLNGGMQQWALELCRSDEVAFDTFIATSHPPYAQLLKESHMKGPPPAHFTKRDASDEGSLAAAVCSQLGLKPGTLSD